MAKTLRTAAIVVGAAALIATGIGAAASLGAIGASAGGAAAAAGATTSAAIAATATSVATLTGLAAAGLSLGSAVTMPKGTVGGNATKFKIDKDSGIPIVWGRTYVGGNVVHRQYYDDPGSRMRNQRESWVTVMSLGPVKSIGPLQIDKKPVYFSGAGAALGDFAGNMWLDTQLGACPEARALRGPTGAFPGWDASSKLSGLAADLWTLDFDSKGKKFPTGLPQRGRVVEGVFGYDPRLDSTYPGGAGPCRIADPSTHVYTENPWVMAITFAYGFYQNGYLIAGGGLAVTGIDLSPFVQAANTADLNGWKAGGVVYTTADDDWDIMKMLAQAGGGEVFAVGGQLTCTHAAPRVSIGTITSDDIIGDIVAPSTASIRVRRNTLIPRIRLEEQGWEVVPIAAVSVPEYLVVDRAPRPKEVEYPLIQWTKQAAEIAMYELLDGRELEPIVLPCKLPAIGYRPGDCVTLEIPEANLVGRDVVLRERELDFGTFGVTFNARSETASKHAYALGTSTTPPPTPDLSVPGLDLDPPIGWAAVATIVPSSSGGVPMPAIVVSGLVDNPGAEAVQFEYRPAGIGSWLSAGVDGIDITRREITAVVAEASYEVAVRYRVRGVLGERLVLGPVTVPKQVLTYEDGTPFEDRKPADKGATKGAPVGTEVGGRPVIDLLSGLDINTVGLIAESLRQDDLVQVFDARTLVDGQAVGTTFKTFRNEQITANSAVNSQLILMGAKNAAGTAWNINLDTVMVAEGKSLGRAFEEIGVKSAELSADLLFLREVLIDSDGATAKFVLKATVTAGGRKVVSGIFGTATGEESGLAFAAENFLFCRLDGTQEVRLLSYSGDRNRWEFSVDVYARRIVADVIEATHIKSGQITGTRSQSFTDRAIDGDETTIAQMTNVQIGDAVDGKGILIVNFSQDGTAAADTAMRVRTYVDMGSGWVLVRNTLQGIRVTGQGDARWVLPVSFVVPLLSSSGTLAVRVTAQGAQINGGGNITGSVARDIVLTVFSGAR